jgi:alpha-L-fucosidase
MKAKHVMNLWYKYLLFFIAASLLFLQSLFAQETVWSERLHVVDSGLIFSDSPFKSCHASSLVALPGKKLMAVWFGGKQEGSPDVSIWMSVYKKGTWNKPKEIANGLQQDGNRYACWNPVLFRNRNGLLFLHYKTGTSPSTWWAEMKTSADNGRTWSSARKLPAGFLGPIKNKPIQLTDGDILYPSSTEGLNDGKWTVHLERSDSKGNNWRKIKVNCDSFDVIQPAILRYSRDTMQLLCRSKQNVIAESWSFDGGNNWQPVEATRLPNPNSGIDAVSLDNGFQLLVYNPLQAGKTGRSVLRLAVSMDGYSWNDVMTLEEHAKGEYSYPAIIQSDHGEIFISYTYNRKSIKYVWLKF